MKRAVDKLKFWRYRLRRTVEGGDLSFVRQLTPLSIRKMSDADRDAAAARLLKCATPCRPHIEAFDKAKLDPLYVMGLLRAEERRRVDAARADMVAAKREVSALKRGRI